ncbi:LbetaH domain-containing protein [Falsiroseomonas ponticola]|uniref:hypothetical protein n=1 Tax=Falsiroseomonas ponticola TaxID=2786951 RepID=UPI001932656F|nr:hypothetical protein [Roseomonas ponticola]
MAEAAARGALLIFAAGGPLAVDMEETAARLGLRLLASIRNRAGPAYTLDPALLADAAALPPALRGAAFACPLFTPAHRRAAVEEALALGLRPAAPLRDPSGTHAASASWAEGSYANAGVLVGALARIGRFALLNRGAGIGHHAAIGDFASVGPGATLAGQVTLGDGAMIGAGAVIAPGVRIGAGAIVAPGAVVRRDVPAGALVAGHPARIMREAR